MVGNLRVNNGCLKTQKPFNKQRGFRCVIRNVWKGGCRQQASPSIGKAVICWMKQSPKQSNIQCVTISTTQVGQPDRQMASHSVSHATKELIRQSTHLSDIKQAIQESVRHYACQPIEQQTTLSDHQPGTIPALDCMHKSSRRFRERVLFVNS